MAKTARTDSRAEMLHDWNRILGLWRVCDNAACRRANACRGNVRACMPVNFAKLPEGVKGWFACLYVAEKEGLSFHEAMAEIEKTSAAGAFRAWHAGEEPDPDPAGKEAA